MLKRKRYGDDHGVAPRAGFLYCFRNDENAVISQFADCEMLTKNHNNDQVKACVTHGNQYRYVVFYAIYYGNHCYNGWHVSAFVTKYPAHSCFIIQMTYAPPRES